MALYRTNAAGADRSQRTLPPLHKLHGSTKGKLRGVTFPTLKSGFALTGGFWPSALYVTRNGARNVAQGELRIPHDYLGIATTKHLVYAVTRVVFVQERSVLALQKSSGRDSTARQWKSFALPIAPTMMKGYKAVSPVIGVFKHSVWVSEQPPKVAVVYYSKNEAATFREVRTRTTLVSMACRLTAESNTSLWSECPTGMQVSFAHSSDAGSTWQYVKQQQFSGPAVARSTRIPRALPFSPTGSVGSWTDSPTTDAPRRRWGRWTVPRTSTTLTRCSSRRSSRGFAICTPGSGRSAMLDTTDGGHSWHRKSFF